MPPSSGQRLPSPSTETTLLEYLFVALQPMSRTKIKETLKDGQVKVNGTTVTQFDHPLRPGDRLALGPREKVDPLAEMLSKAGMRLVHSDSALLALDKPSGLLSVATEGEHDDTAFAILNHCLTDNRRGKAYIVHRLDRDTSGLILFARSETVRDRLQENWPAVRKTYLAVVVGAPKPPEGSVRNRLDEGKDFRVRLSAQGKDAVTHYRTVQAGRRYSLLEVDLETGRKHQIRVHLTGLGCPVIGDDVYGVKDDPAKRLGLHAWKLTFPHPLTRDAIALESPLPDVLRRVLGDRPLGAGSPRKPRGGGAL